jgi:hypothetical protein
MITPQGGDRIRRAQEACARAARAWLSAEQIRHERKSSR